MKTDHRSAYRAAISLLCLTCFLQGFQANAQAARVPRAEPSLTVGGYRVAIGMPIATLNSTISSVFRPEMYAPDQYLYYQGADLVAKIWHDDGKVRTIAKFFGQIRDGEPVADAQLRGIREAQAEFARLSRGRVCSIVTPSSDDDETSSGLVQFCGPFELRVRVWSEQSSSGKYLGVTSAILVTSNVAGSIR